MIKIHAEFDGQWQEYSNGIVIKSPGNTSGKYMITPHRLDFNFKTIDLLDYEPYSRAINHNANE